MDGYFWTLGLWKEAQRHPLLLPRRARTGRGTPCESAVVPCPYRSRADRPSRGRGRRHLLGQQLAPAGPAGGGFFEGATLAGRGTIPGAPGEPEWCARSSSGESWASLSSGPAIANTRTGRRALGAPSVDLAPQCRGSAPAATATSPVRIGDRLALRRHRRFRFDLAGIGIPPAPFRGCRSVLERVVNGRQRRGDGGVDRAHPARVRGRAGPRRRTVRSGLAHRARAPSRRLHPGRPHPPGTELSTPPPRRARPSAPRRGDRPVRPDRRRTPAHLVRRGLAGAGSRGWPAPAHVLRALSSVVSDPRCRRTRTCR